MKGFLFIATCVPVKNLPEPAFRSIRARSKLCKLRDERATHKAFCEKEIVLTVVYGI